jgi:hypothetical protein
MGWCGAGAGERQACGACRAGDIEAARAILIDCNAAVVAPAIVSSG